MNDSGPLHARLEHHGHHLDELAARATRSVAALRSQSQSVRDDVTRWREHLDLSGVDTELARLDARDELHRARAVLQARAAKISKRLDEAGADAVDALRTLREALDEALHDVGRSFGVRVRDER